MVCYNHQDRPAVGVCRHCQRGLCMECADLVSDVVACRGRHDREVTEALRAAALADLQFKRTAAGYVRSGVFYGLAGSAFAALGLIQLRFLGLQAVFFILIGLFLLYASAANFLEARRFP